MSGSSTPGPALGGAELEHRKPGEVDRIGGYAFVVGPTLLAQGAAHGPLEGLQFAVKDLIDVAGTRTGCGSPDWLASAPIATENAPVVSALLAAGADCCGKTLTDELAFSLSGTNVHYGTPENPAVPGSVPGGSSSGSASAVASGTVDLALGTDTGGSIRVPASYCGIWGIRPTHGRIDDTGVAPLAPSFDTVGVLAGSARVLASGFQALDVGCAPAHTAPGAPGRKLRRLILDPGLLALGDGGAQGEVALALRDAATTVAHDNQLELVEGRLASPEELADYRDAFRVLQMLEIWARHGTWITTTRPRLGPGIAARFEAAAKVSPALRPQAEIRRDELRRRLADLLDEDAVLAQPAASGPAPPILQDQTTKDDLRARTLMLTAPAGLAGAPVVSLPLAQVAGGPVGLALVGLRGDDATLIELAVSTAPRF